MIRSPLKNAAASAQHDSPPPEWPVALEAEKFMRLRLESFLQRNNFARELALQMHQQTATDFFEWIDHMVLAREDEINLRELGFVTERSVTLGGEPVLVHPRAALPRVILRRESESPALVAIRPEFIADFVSAHSLRPNIDGDPFSRFRQVPVSREYGTQLDAIERNAYRGFVPAPLDSAELENLICTRELWRTRRRHCASDREGFDTAMQVLGQVFERVGRDSACHLFFQEERRYWETRNRAARIQKNRQDRLGLGWGNHERHTFYCSREHFQDFIQFLQPLGFEKREHFASEAQHEKGTLVCEQPQAGIIVFCEVDLEPNEGLADFTVRPLTSSAKLGPVGEWVALHGESFLEAGLHHLGARFEMDPLRVHLEERKERIMAPSVDVDYFRQTLTEAENRSVRRERAEKLLHGNQITRQRYESYITSGAPGSHLQILERHGGYKGCNPDKITDPKEVSEGADK